MNTYVMENATKTVGEKTLFTNVSFHIQEKERVGLIGINGTGKTSLLAMIAGLDDGDGCNRIHANDYSIGYVMQDMPFDEEETVIEHVFKGQSTIMKTMRQYELALVELQDDPESVEKQDKLFRYQKEMDTYNAWDANANAKMILSKLGINQIHQKMSELSGGQQKRVSLAQVLVETPDLLILDEPTNHLDTESVQWLTHYLNNYPHAVLLVSHDRYFLDSVTTRMIELSNQQLYSYQGNYQQFIQAKAEREANEAATSAKKKNLYRNELAWMRRGAKARTTKQKARIQRFEHLEDSLIKDNGKQQVDMNVQGARLGKQVVELKNISKSFQHRMFIKNFSLLVKPGDRIGIVGANGEGKSTLLNIIAGSLQVDEGERIVGQTVKFAYFTQTMEPVNGDQRMIEYVRESGEVVHTSEGEAISVAQMLERFLFPLHTHGTLVRKLSGGEKRRLYLLKLLMQKPNVLLLDEPTNDLDTETLTVLEQYLEEFSGVVITVSHDRYFLDKVVDHLLVFRGNGVIEHFLGEYTEFLESEVEREKKQALLNAEKVAPVKQERKSTTPKRLSYKEQIEWEAITPEMEKLEERLLEIEEELERVGSDFEKAQQLFDEQHLTNERLEVLIERWSELEEKQNN